MKNAVLHALFSHTPEDNFVWSIPTLLIVMHSVMIGWSQHSGKEYNPCLYHAHQSIAWKKLKAFTCSLKKTPNQKNTQMKIKRME